MKTKVIRQIVHDELLLLDHCVISGEKATEYCSAFGVSPLAEKEHPTAYREDGTPVIGVAIHELAEHLCRQLKVPYVFQFGKGSQLRVY